MYIIYEAKVKKFITLDEFEEKCNNDIEKIWDYCFDMLAKNGFIPSMEIVGIIDDKTGKYGKYKR